MAIGSGSKVILGYVEEVTRGTTPGSPTLKSLRATQRNVNLEKNILTSAEVRQSRQRSDVRHGLNRVGGPVGFQLSRIDYDDMLAYATGGAWTRISSKGTYGTAAASNTFTRASGSFLTDGFRPGDYITTTGFTTGANNGTFRVTAVTALSITVDFDITVSDTGDGNELIYLAGGTASGVTSGIGTFATAAASNDFTRASGSFVTDGFQIGDIIQTSGFTTAANNGFFKVLNVVALAITVDFDITVSDTGTGDELIVVAPQGRRLDMGSILKTVTMERQFIDLPLYQVHKGVAVNQMNLRVSPEAMVGGTFDFIGMSSLPLSGTSVSGGAPTANSGSSPYSSFDGSLLEGGTLIAVATALNFSINNQRTLAGVIGSKFSPDVFEGTAIITGDLQAFIENSTLFNKFVNETESSLWLRLNDLNALDFMSIIFHRLKYTGSNMDPGQEGPVTQAMPFEALEHTTFGTAITFQRSNA